MVDGNPEGERFVAPIPVPGGGAAISADADQWPFARTALMQEEIFRAWYLSRTTFRTPEEAVALANNTR